MKAPKIELSKEEIANRDAEFKTLVTRRLTEMEITGRIISWEREEEEWGKRYRE